jgi:hypothetical protein
LSSFGPCPVVSLLGFLNPNPSGLSLLQKCPWECDLFSSCIWNIYVTWQFVSLQSRLADPRCLSRILYLDFYPSRFPHPKTATEERSGKKFVVIPFYVDTNFTKLKIISVLKCRKKKFGPIFKDL